MMKPEHIELAELRYSTDTHGALKLYLLDRNGRHKGGQWFARRIRYPEEEIPFKLARDAVEAWLELGLEVRICNGGDLLVYHALEGNVVFPLDAERFWETAGR